MHRTNGHPRDSWILHCGDERIAEGFRQYLRSRGFLTDTSICLELFGGGHCLAQSEKGERDGWLNQIAVAVTEGIHTVIIANHEDCVFYHRHSPEHGNTVAAHTMDVRNACDLVQAVYPRLRVFGFVIPLKGHAMGEPVEVYTHPANTMRNGRE